MPAIAHLETEAVYDNSPNGCSDSVRCRGVGIAGMFEHGTRRIFEVDPWPLQFCPGNVGADHSSDQGDDAHARSAVGECVGPRANSKAGAATRGSDGGLIPRRTETTRASSYRGSPGTSARCGLGSARNP